MVSVLRPVDDCNLKRDIEMLRQQTVQDIDFVSASEFTTLTILTCTQD